MPYFIKSKQAQGRFRGGRPHAAEGRAWPDTAFTAEQLTAIHNDPELEVRELSQEEYDALRKEETAAWAENVAATGMALKETLTAIADAAKQGKAAKTETGKKASAKAKPAAQGDESAKDA